MTTEDDFLAVLTANPADDTARLVYADWLEEHGDDARAAYLRAVVEVVQACREGRPDGPEAARLRASTPHVPDEWAWRIGARFSAVLYGFSFDRKIHVIKVLREVVGAGLAEAKQLSESVPLALPLAGGTLFEQAYRIWSHVRTGSSAVVGMEPHGDPPFSDGRTYRLSAWLSIWDAETWPERQEGGEAVFRNFLTAAGVVPRETGEPGFTDRTVLATGLEAAAVPARLADYRALVPRDLLARGVTIHIPSEPEPSRP